jgi:hypothetical protein
VRLEDNRLEALDLTFLLQPGIVLESFVEHLDGLSLTASYGSPETDEEMPGTLTAHTEPNPSTCRRVVAAAIPLPAAMRYTSAGTTTAAQGPPCAKSPTQWRQPRCEVVVATTAREQLM